MIKLIYCVFTTLIFLSPTAAQSLQANGQTSTDTKAQQELNKKTLTLLAELAQQARDLKNKNNQIVARMGIAELIWKDQEAGARRLYQEALNNLHETMAGIDQDDPEAYNEYSDLTRLRDRLFQSIGQHDPIWARDLLKDSRLNKTSGSSADTPAEEAAAAEKAADDSGLELSLATQMVERDPKEATRIARESLSKGLSFQLTALISKLAEKDPKAAGDLALEVIDKVRHADLESNYGAVSVAVYLVSEAILSSLPAGTQESTEKRPPILDQLTAKEFIEFVTDLATKKSDGGDALLMNLAQMVDELESVAPAQAKRLKERIAETQKPTPASANYNRLQKMSEETDAKAMLELAQKASPEMRDHMYGEAAALMWDDGDRDKAMEIARKNISNPVERDRLLTQFRDQALAELLEKEDFAQAKVLIAQIRSADDRVGQLIHLAEVMWKKNDKKGASDVLAEAQSFLPPKARNVTELETRSKLAGAYSEIDPNRGFALITSMIDQMNELIAASAVVANFGTGPSSFKNDEFEIDSYTPASYGFAMLSKDTIRALALVDFNRAKAMLERFQRPEIRLAALLKLSESILTPPDEDCTCQQRAKTKRRKPANN